MLQPYLAPMTRGSKRLCGRCGCVQLERAGAIEAGSGGEGLASLEDPQLLTAVMEAREAIEEAQARRRPPRTTTFDLHWD